MAHKVICIYCGQKFDRDKEPTIKIGERKYAHQQCYDTCSEEQQQEQKDKAELEAYIMKLLKQDYINPRIQRQIKNYVDTYHYTYTGMLKSLVYFYEIEKNDIDEANGGIGIIPWVYEKAKKYYLALWRAEQKNQDKNLKDYIPTNAWEVNIPPPKRNPIKPKRFSFLDKDIELE